jgi:DUF971 family protein
MAESQATDLRPTHLGRDGTDYLKITWNDGHESTYAWRHLRSHCPCATCREAREQPTDPFRILSDREVSAGPLQPVALTPVGYYAYQITWNDGHGSGIFTLEHLRSLCQCRDCTQDKKK